MNDAELVELARAGDLDAYGILIRRHHAPVAGLCRSLLENRPDAEDAAQEIFLKAYRSLHGFKGDSQFSTWLYRITMNHCLNIRRRAVRGRTVSLDALIQNRGELAGEPLQGSKLSADMIEDAELAEEHIARLPETYRDALILRAQGLRYRQIAQTLGCSVDAVKARLRRARSNLAEKMRHQNPSDGVKALGNAEDSL
jgi:RNA polymerase sigma-70 factor (ECF subfamily)